MRRLLLLAVVVLVGLLLGALVAGRPETVPNDLQAADIPPSTRRPRRTSPTPTTTIDARRPPRRQRAAATTTVSRASRTHRQGAVAPTSTVAVTTTEAPGTTVAPTTTEPPTTTSTLASMPVHRGAGRQCLRHLRSGDGIGRPSCATWATSDVIRGDGLQERGYQRLVLRRRVRGRGDPARRADRHAEQPHCAPPSRSAGARPGGGRGVVDARQRLGERHQPDERCEPASQRNARFACPDACVPVGLRESSPPMARPGRGPSP